MTQKFYNMEQDKNKLIEEADFVQKNIDWWIFEVEKVCNEIDNIDNIDSNLSREEIQQKFNKLEYLVGKADMEIQQIDDLEVKSIQYFKKLYAKNKPGNAKLVRRKKRKLF